MLTKLLKHSYPDLWAAFGFLPNRLELLRELRNKFAHSEVVLSDAPPPAESAEGVTLRYFKEGKQVDEFVSRAEVDRRIAECLDLQMTALLLENVMKGRACGNADTRQEAACCAGATAIKNKIR